MLPGYARNSLKFSATKVLVQPDKGSAYPHIHSMVYLVGTGFSVCLVQRFIFSRWRSRHLLLSHIFCSLHLADIVISEIH